MRVCNRSKTRADKAKIRKAFETPYVKATVMNHTWKNVEEKEFVVKDLFDENGEFLIDDVLLISIDEDFLKD